MFYEPLHAMAKMLVRRSTLHLHFEDDVLLGENANKFLAEDEWLEERFKQTDKFILRFETFLNFSKCKDKKN